MHKNCRCGAATFAGHAYFILNNVTVPHAFTGNQWGLTARHDSASVRNMIQRKAESL